MILIWLILIPMLGGILAWLLGAWIRPAAHWISLLTMVADLALVLWLWVQNYGRVGIGLESPWLAETTVPWIPQFGVTFHLAMDGLSLVLLALTAFLGIVAVGASWDEIQERVGLYHFSLLWALAGISGVFLSLDLFLFYLFWELMLVPTYLLYIWGYERRFYAAVKFFLFTQISGLLMLLAILGLFFVHGQSTGSYTFDYGQLLGTTMDRTTATWLMLGFFVAFAVKLPAVPFHPWLPDAYTEAPMAGTVILAGLMAKTAGYGLIRLVVPLFPSVALDFAGIAMPLGVAGILYGALLAFAQTDVKRLVAYSSLSHMGFVLLGIFAWNELALQGAVMVMLAHGVSTGALFVLVGWLQERTHTREMARLGGLWSTMPRMGGVMLLFAMAALGLPGLGNFVGEFLVLVGSYRANLVATVLAAVGIVLATAYALWLIQRTFQGPNIEGWTLPDLSWREAGTMACMIAAIFWLGLYPRTVLNTAGQALSNLQQTVAASRAEELTTELLGNRREMWETTAHQEGPEDAERTLVRRRPAHFPGEKGMKPQPVPSERRPVPPTGDGEGSL